MCGTGSRVSAEWGSLRTRTIRRNPKLKNSILREHRLLQRHYLLVVVLLPVRISAVIEHHAESSKEI